VTAGAGTAKQDFDCQRRFVSELFHSLSQPLTALHCSLDLALQRESTVEQLRASIQAACESAECLRQRLLLVRAMADATDPGDLSSPTDLNELLRDLCQDMLPLFESAGKRLEVELESGPLPVRGDRTRLMQALFYFLEYLFRHSVPGSAVTIRLGRQDSRAEITVAAVGCPQLEACEVGAVAPASWETEIFRRSFLAAGGEVTPGGTTPDRSVWRATLELA